MVANVSTRACWPPAPLFPLIRPTDVLSPREYRGHHYRNWVSRAVNHIRDGGFTGELIVAKDLDKVDLG